MKRKLKPKFIKIKEIVDTLKLLGITLDSKLHFGPHINNVHLSCMNDLTILRSMTCGEFGIYPRLSILIYRILIISKLECCSLVFDIYLKPRYRNWR